METIENLRQLLWDFYGWPVGKGGDRPIICVPTVRDGRTADWYIALDGTPPRAEVTAYPDGHAVKRVCQKWKPLAKTVAKKIGAFVAEHCSFNDGAKAFQIDPDNIKTTYPQYPVYHSSLSEMLDNLARTTGKAPRIRGRLKADSSSGLRAFGPIDVEIRWAPRLTAWHLCRKSGKSIMSAPEPSDFLTLMGSPDTL